MAATTLDRPQGAPRLADLAELADVPAPAATAAKAAPAGGLADLAGLATTIERDGPEPDEAPAAPAAARPAPKPAPKPAPLGGLADLAGLDTTIERDGDPEEAAAPAAPVTVAAPAPAPARAPSGLADLAGLDTTIERDGPEPEEAPAAAAPAAPSPAAPSAPAPIVPRTARQLPAAPAAAAGSEPDLDQILRQSARDLTAPPPGVDPVTGAAPDAGYPAGSPEEGAAADGQDPAVPGEAADAETKEAPIEVEPLRPVGLLDPDDAHFGAGHAAQVVEAALRGMPADPATLELARRWQEIDGAHSRRYREATEEFRRHKALEDVRAPDAAVPADGRPGRGGGLTSIARGLASLGRRGVQAKLRSNTRMAGQELDNLRGDYENEATNFLGNLFAVKARHYDDRLQEMGLQHGALNDAVTRYNRAFAAAPAAASFLAAVKAYGGANGLSEDDALAAAASGKAGAEVAAALATVKGATLADPAVDAARAGMREAEEAFADTARRAQKDFESMLRFSTPDSDFDAEQTRDELLSKVNALVDGTKAPVAEDEDKAKLQERMRELAESIQRMIREMFERMFKAVTGAFGR